MIVIERSIQIAADPALVFECLLDLPRYSEWNPMTPRIEGTLVPSEPLSLFVALVPGLPLLRQSARVERVDRDARKLVWSVVFLHRSLLRAERTQSVESHGAGALYRTEDRFEGAFRFAIGALRPLLARGFGEMAAALKKQVETSF